MPMFNVHNGDRVLAKIEAATHHDAALQFVRDENKKDAASQQLNEVFGVVQFSKPREDSKYFTTRDLLKDVAEENANGGVGPRLCKL
jgi:hypothetical protein